VFHELLSNAGKFGALASAEGSVLIDWQQEADDRLKLTWCEMGGPPPRAHRPRHLGLMLIEQTVQRQLIGRAMFDWKPTGLHAEFVFATQ
jgi:two-component sensor histidine kinase